MVRLREKDIIKGDITSLLEKGWKGKFYEDQKGQVAEISFILRSNSGPLRGISYNRNDWTERALGIIAKLGKCKRG